jgi:flagellar basal body-associated protein FliL
MADKPDKKPAEAPAAEHDEKKGGKGGGLLSKTPVLMGIVMLVEAVVLIGGLKFLTGGPKHADAGAVEGAPAGDGHGDASHGSADAKPKEKKKTIELPLLEFRGVNKVSGRSLIFDVAMVVSVKAEHEEAVKKIITDRKALITDRVRTIIAQSDPEKLSGGSEPGLETLRRQVRYQLDQIVEHEGMIDDVLVPRCIPFRADL